MVVETIEEWIREIEEWSIEFAQYEKQKGNLKKKNKDSETPGNITKDSTFISSES